MTRFVGRVLEPQRHLPAHRRLPVHRSLTGLERGMCSAQPTPPSKPTRLRKMHASSTTRVVVTAEPSASGSPSREPLLALPYGSWNCHCAGVSRSAWRAQVGDVVVVDEVGAVAAAALRQLGGRLVEDPLAAAAEDAAPVRTQEAGIEHPRALLVGIFETHPLVEVAGGVVERRARLRNASASIGSPAI